MSKKLVIVGVVVAAVVGVGGYSAMKVQSLRAEDARRWAEVEKTRTPDACKAYIDWADEVGFFGRFTSIEEHSDSADALRKQANVATLLQGFEVAEAKYREHARAKKIAPDVVEAMVALIRHAKEKYTQKKGNSIRVTVDQKRTLSADAEKGFSLSGDLLATLRRKGREVMAGESVDFAVYPGAVSDAATSPGVAVLCTAFHSAPFRSKTGREMAGVSVKIDIEIHFPGGSVKLPTETVEPHGTVEVKYQKGDFPKPYDFYSELGTALGGAVDERIARVLGF